MAEPGASTATTPENEYGRVKLRCRRGTRELDLMLIRFIDTQYLSLSMDEQTQFDQLLDQHDPVLTAWLFGQVQPGDNSLARLVDRIRQTFRH